MITATARRLHLGFLGGVASLALVACGSEPESSGSRGGATTAAQQAGSGLSLGQSRSTCEQDVRNFSKIYGEVREIATGGGTGSGFQSTSGTVDAFVRTFDQKYARVTQPELAAAFAGLKTSATALQGVLAAGAGDAAAAATATLTSMEAVGAVCEAGGVSISWM
jgi:hypothetical protein